MQTTHVIISNPLWEPPFEWKPAVKTAGPLHRISPFRREQSQILETTLVNPKLQSLRFNSLNSAVTDGKSFVWRSFHLRSTQKTACEESRLALLRSSFCRISWVAQRRVSHSPSSENAPGPQTLHVLPCISKAQKASQGHPQKMPR